MSGSEEWADRVLAWYDDNARDLPWRRPEATPWGIVVSEFMLQQTPVVRVLPRWQEWLERWPTPADLAVEPVGEAIRAWGRLGYPRRALRLHATAVAIVEQHGGEVPRDPAELRTLPGIGDYTAAAIAAFAFGAAVPVLDTNVRRVHARLLDGTEFPRPSITTAERSRAAELLPDEAATFSVAVMELGALVCTAADPTCADCPVVAECAWTAAGRPAHDGPPRPVQTYAGTDRQCRGRLLAVLREAAAPVTKGRLDAAWPSDAVQRERALDSLLADGLAELVPPGRYRLPGDESAD